MEVEAAARGAAGWLTRYALPRSGRTLLVAIEGATGTRALLLPLPKAEIPPKKEWPNSEGLEVFALRLDAEFHLGVRLRAVPFADVFSVLAEDIARQVAEAPDPKAAASAMLARIRRWRKFLAAAAAGLSIEGVRGLVGELLLLRDHLLGSLGPSGAVTAWRAPLRAHQDFQALGGAIEVKATTAKQPQTIRITSERQLDTTGLVFLYLHVVILDERIFDPEQPVVGERLPDLVNDLRRRLERSPESAEDFEDRLLEAGYLDAEAHRYADRLFTPRGEKTFLISEGFPRILELNLPSGIGDVSYSISLPACEPFAVKLTTMLQQFAGGTTTTEGDGGASDA